LRVAPSAFGEVRVSQQSEAIAVGRRNAEEVQSKATSHDGPFMGRPRSGKQVRFDSVDVMRVRDGQIVAHWGVGDLLGLLQQLGIVPPLTLDTPPAPGTLPSDAKR